MATTWMLAFACLLFVCCSAVPVPVTVESAEPPAGLPLPFPAGALPFRHPPVFMNPFLPFNNMAMGHMGAAAQASRMAAAAEKMAEASRAAAGQMAQQLQEDLPGESAENENAKDAFDNALYRPAKQFLPQMLNQVVNGFNHPKMARAVKHPSIDGLVDAVSENPNFKAAADSMAKMMFGMLGGMTGALGKVMENAASSDEAEGGEGLFSNLVRKSATHKDVLENLNRIRHDAQRLVGEEGVATRTKLLKAIALRKEALEHQLEQAQLSPEEGQEVAELMQRVSRLTHIAGSSQQEHPVIEIRL